MWAVGTLAVMVRAGAGLRQCDERVVALGARPSDYAGHLLAIARSLSERTSGPSTPARRIPATALAMIHRSQLEGALRGRIGVLHGQAGRLRGQIGVLRSQERMLRSQIGILRSEISLLRQERSALGRLGRGSDELAEIEKRMAANEDRIRALEERLEGSGLERQVTELRRELDALRVDERIAEIEAGLEPKVDRLHQILDDLGC